MFYLFGMIREKGFSMISKELWIEVINPDFKSDVFKDGIIETFELENNTLKVCIFSESNNINCKGTGLYTPYNINIYELAHKCKEWAIKYIANIGSGYDKDKEFYWCICNNGEFQFYADTELQAIFKACEWLLDNKED